MRRPIRARRLVRPAGRAARRRSSPTPAAPPCAPAGCSPPRRSSEQADESLDRLLQAGFEPDSTPIQATHFTLATPAITTTYANAYGRFGVQDNLCDLSFAGVDQAFAPAPLAPAQLAQSFGTGNGIPPTSGIQIINDVSVGGARENTRSITPSTGAADYNIDAAACQRDLWTGTDDRANRVRAGVQEVLRTGDLQGKPAIIVAGRADALIPVNFNARPYLGLNRAVEGAASRLSYVEVTNAQHFDAFIDLPALAGYDTAFVPLHHYFLQAMDRMWATLTTNAPLPPSQLVRTTPRGGVPGLAPAITAANLPSDRADARAVGRDHRDRRGGAGPRLTLDPRRRGASGDPGPVGTPYRNGWWPPRCRAREAANYGLAMPELPLGSVVGGVRIDAVTGRGGMGVVYRGTQIALKRTVALKVVRDDLASDPEFRRRFTQESEIAASLDHPNIVPIHSAGEDAGRLYVTMRFVEGTDVREAIRMHGRLAPALAAEIVAQVAAALDAAHRRGLVHRDVKPANILLANADGRAHAYLTDFGLSRFTDSEQITRTGTVVGTLDYMAPEQLEGRKVDGRVDVYALGCVLYQALTGRVPYPRDTEHAKMWAHMTEPPPRPGAVAPDLPPGFDEVVARAMAKKPDDRYATAVELGAAAVAAAQQAGRAAVGRRPHVDIPRQASAPPTEVGPQWSGRGRPGRSAAPPPTAAAGARPTRAFRRHAVRRRTGPQRPRPGWSPHGGAQGQRGARGRGPDARGQGNGHPGWPRPAQQWGPQPFVGGGSGGTRRRALPAGALVPRRRRRRGRAAARATTGRRSR